MATQRFTLMSEEYSFIQNQLEEGEVIRIGRCELQDRTVEITRRNSNGERRGSPASLAFLDKVATEGGAEDLALRAGTAVERLELRIASLVQEQQDLHKQFRRSDDEYKSLTSIWSVLVGEGSCATIDISDKLSSCKRVKELPIVRTSVHPSSVVINTKRTTQRCRQSKVRKKYTVSALAKDNVQGPQEVNVLGLVPVNQEDLFPTLGSGAFAMEPTLEQLIDGNAL